MSKAFALWIVSPRSLQIKEEDLPELGPGDVRVQTIVSAISHGTEMLVYRGQVSPELDLDLPDLQGSFALPIKYGYASVGKVAEVGAEVEDLVPEDIVFVLHPHQTEYIVPACRAYRVAHGINPEDAVFLANAETALNAHLDCPVLAGKNVLVFGQGVVGLLIARLAWLAGAEQVITVDQFLQRRQVSLRFAGGEALEPRRALERVLSLTTGRGADVVFEASGAPDALQQAIDCCAFEGSIVACSWYGNKPVTLNLGAKFHRDRLKIISSQVGHINPSLTGEWDYRQRRETALRLVSELKPSQLITHRFLFSEAAEAYKLIGEHPEETIQITLSYGG